MKSQMKSRLLGTLRYADKPALSAADLADSLDVSVKTVNKEIAALVERGDVLETQIGNAAAYYLPESDIPAHQKPDHICKRCGRECSRIHDMGKIEINPYFTASWSQDFFVVCRFCYADFISWIFGEDSDIGEYRDVHSWDIPDEQLKTVRRDPDIPTSPDEPSGDNATVRKAYETLQTLAKEETDESDDVVVSKQDLMSELQEELGDQASEAYSLLKRRGYFAEQQPTGKILLAD